MDTEKFVELTKTLDKKKKGKQEGLEKIQKYFDRFHLINRNYLNKEVYEKPRAPSHPCQRPWSTRSSISMSR